MSGEKSVKALASSALLERHAGFASRGAPAHRIDLARATHGLREL
jgi:hypothetical protein